MVLKKRLSSKLCKVPIRYVYGKFTDFFPHTNRRQIWTEGLGDRRKDSLGYDGSCRIPVGRLMLRSIKSRVFTFYIER